MRHLAISGLMLLAIVACSKQEANSGATAAVVATAAKSAAAEGAPVAQMGGAVIEQVEGEKVTGKVVESLSASGFTYVLLDHGKTKEWYVLGPVGLKKGERLELETRMVAERFESKSLKRTFDKVTFARVVSGGSPVPIQPTQEHASMMSTALEMPAGHPTADGASPHGSMGMNKTSVADAGPIKVAKAEGASGRTIAEIWASRSQLGDGNVVVRGKVVKSLNGIMGKHWIHLRDGSGSDDQGNNDITITTNESAKVGDVILVSGVVRVDKDFGGGYQYQVIIEDGKITKQ